MVLLFNGTIALGAAIPAASLFPVERLVAQLSPERRPA